MLVTGLRQCACNATLVSAVLLFVLGSTALASPRACTGCYETPGAEYKVAVARPRRSIEDNSIFEEVEDVDRTNNIDIKGKSQGLTKDWYAYESKLVDGLERNHEATTGIRFSPHEKKIVSGNRDSTISKGSVDDKHLRDDQDGFPDSVETVALDIREQKINPKIWRHVVSGEEHDNFNRVEKEGKEIIGDNYDSYEALIILPPVTEAWGILAGNDGGLGPLLDVLLQAPICDNSEPKMYDTIPTKSLTTTDNWGISTDLTPSSLITESDGISEFLRFIFNLLESLDAFQPKNPPGYVIQNTQQPRASFLQIL